MSWLARAAAAPFRVWHAIADEIAKERRIFRTGQPMQWIFGRDSYAGKTVSLESALQLSAAWACIMKTAQAVASLPMIMYERGAGDSRERVDGDRIAELIGVSPNADQTALEFWETQVAWLLAAGNAYAEKDYTGATLSALLPIPSSLVTPRRTDDGELVYLVNDRGRTVTLPAVKIFHLRGFGQGLVDRDTGLSPIAYARHSLGTAMAADESAGKMFGNGMQPAGILTSDQTLNREQRTELGRIMNEFVGSDKAGKLMILEAGLKYEGISLNPDDAQMLETRRFGIEEVCRWFGVPPIVIGHTGEGQTMWGSGVEQILVAWLTLGIDPLCDRIERRILKDLIRSTGDRRRYAEFNREALLQMDSKAKANFLSQMTQNGLMTRNEGRAKLNLPRVDEGNADALTVQTSLAPIERLGAGDAEAARQAFMRWLGVTTRETPVDD